MTHVRTEGPDLQEPYVGFQPYDEARAGYLGGRDTDIRAIDANVRVAPLTIVYGPTGVGKTSSFTRA